MDRSLSFFMGIDGKKKSVDTNTGLSTSTFNGQANITEYDNNDPNNPVVKQETKKYNYSVVQSALDENTFINYLGNSSTNAFDPYVTNPEHESDIKLSDIINWTQKSQPSLILQPKHFAYLKDFNTYPANRMVVLRRFGGPMPHNIFDRKSKPIATIV